MFGLNNLFWYYKQSVRKNVEVKMHDFDLPAEQCFGTYVRIKISFFK